MVDVLKMTRLVAAAAVILSGSPALAGGCGEGAPAPRYTVLSQTTETPAPPTPPPAHVSAAQLPAAAPTHPVPAHPAPTPPPAAPPAADAERPIVVPQASRLRVYAEQMGTQTGRVLLTAGPLRLDCEVLAWDGESVLFRLPATDVRTSLAVQLSVLRSGGSPARTLGLTLAPPRGVEVVSDTVASR